MIKYNVICDGRMGVESNSGQWVNRVSPITHISLPSVANDKGRYAALTDSRAFS